MNKNELWFLPNSFFFCSNFYISKYLASFLQIGVESKYLSKSFEKNPISEPLKTAIISVPSFIPPKPLKRINEKTVPDIKNVMSNAVLNFALSIL